jgi:SAP domain
VTLYMSSGHQALGPVPGCAEQHLRPKAGQPALRWGVDCAAHEAYHMGYGRPKVLKYITDPKTGAVLSQQRVLDSHPGFSTSPDAIPLTFDEVQSRDRKLEMGENQLRALESLITLKRGGIDLTSRPEVMYFLQESGLSAEMLQGKVVCANGHDNAAGNAFCGSCGISMDAQAAIAPPPAAAEPAADLGGLHVAKLKKLARDRGLPDGGSKAELIQRLQAA